VAAEELSPAYLIAGTDMAKIDAVIARLRDRAERDGGVGSLEAFAAAPGAGPDSEAIVDALPAMSLTSGRRYLLADGVERWSAKQAGPVVAALGDLPPDLTLVLVAREQPPKVRAPKALADAVKGANGRVLEFQAPRARALPGWLVAEADRRGFVLDADAAQLLAERMGEGTVRLSTELDRLATWAGEDGHVGREDLEGMVADTSEEASWALADALLDRDPGAALGTAERLAGQGEALTPLVYGAAKRLRDAHLALGELERGRSPKELESSLPMHPYAAKMLLRRLRGASLGDLRAASCAVADLEWWTRGGSDYPDDVALTLALRRAAGARVRG
jgi:DNA polymerase-3 subunit delta